MTLIVSITTPEGIIMASDSRQTLRNPKQMTRISTDNAVKLFKINDRIVLGTAGLAFFTDDTGVHKSISAYVNDFCDSVDLEDISVEQLAKQLHAYLNRKYSWQKQLNESVEQLKKDVENKGARLVSVNQQNSSVKFRIQHVTGDIEEGTINVEPINVLINGFDKDGSCKTYELLVPGDIIRKRDNGEYGCTWVGQGDVVSRLILGYDGKILNLPMFKELSSSHSQEDILNQLHGTEYNIQWPVLTLQDSINIAVFLIKVTAVTQFYADGITMDAGDTQGVGGPIDVALITKHEGVQWIKHKKLEYPSFE